MLIIRELEVKDFGGYSFLMSFVTITTYLSHLGFPGLLQKYLPTMSPDSSLILSNQLLYIKMIFVLIVTVIFLLANYFFHIIDMHSAMVLTGIVVLGSINSFILQNYYTITLEHSFVYKRLLFMALVKLCAVYFLIYEDRLTVQNILYLILFYESGLVFMSLTKYKISPYFSYFKIKYIFSESKHFIKGKLFELLFIPAVAIIYLKVFHTLDDVAKYSFIVSISLLITSNVSILSRFEVVINKIAITNGKDDNFYRSLIALWYKVFLLLILPFTAIIYFSSAEVAYFLFKGKYDDVMYLLPISISFLFLSHVSYLYTPTIYLNNHLDRFSKNSIITGLTHISMLFILGHFFGFIGAIFSLLIAYNIKAINLIYIYGMLISTSKLLISMLYITITTIFVFLIFDNLLSIDSLFSLISISLIKFFCILSILILFNFFTSREKDLFKTLKGMVR